MLLFVGQVLRPHGLRGEVVVAVRTDSPAERFAVGSVLTTDPTAVRRPPDAPVPEIPATLMVETARVHQGRYLVGFAGVPDRDAADALRGVLLCVDRDQVSPSDDPDVFNDFELVGLAAVDPAGNQLGEVLRVDHPPAADQLVLGLPDGRTALVPFVKAMVPQVDLAARRIVLTLPGGLLDL